MPEPEWLIKARNDLGKAVRWGHGTHCEWPCRHCEAVTAEVARIFARETEAAYKRGLMAGRSQANYPTRRKRKEQPCAPSAETRSPASSTGSEP